MVSALVLVNTDLDSQDSVLENLKRVDGVEEAHALYGVMTVWLKSELHPSTNSRI
jgi:hypothetical protein